MTARTSLLLGGLLLSAACGGGGDSGPNGTIWAGTLTVTSAGTAGNPCAATHQITFTAAGADIHVLNVAGDDCLDFVNSDTAPHKPGAIGTNLCAQLDAPASIPAGGHFLTAPFVTAGVCQWQDDLNPVPTGGGSGY